MTHYTPEDLLLYLYKETSPSQSAAIKAALDQDWALNEKFKVLESSVKLLDGTSDSPRMQVLLNVLSYARKTMAETV